MSEAFRSGFVAMVGRPNVGKSTLLNRLVGRKVAITSDKPQTTRNKVVGVVHRPGVQIVLLDTPGIHRPFHRLGEFMVQAARRALEGVDAVLLVVAADPAGPGPGDREAAGVVGGSPAPVLLVVNKVDLLGGAVPPDLLEAYAALGRFAGVFPVSAHTGQGLEELVRAVAEILPEGPPYFPEDMVTDQPERVFIAEVIREKILQLCREEVPHAVAVDVEQMAERDNGMLYVAATIYAEKESQKGILIGRGGSMLKEIGRLARAELEPRLGTRIYLDLWLKVKEDWRNREGALQSFGYRLE